MDPFTFLTSMFGGGILGALINGALAERDKRREREINFLDKQIRELYGPLYYITSQAEKLFALNKVVLEGWRKDEGVVYSQDAGTQKILKERDDQTFEIANKYISYVKNNNDKIDEILSKSYPLIDPEDVEIFLVFFEHYIRMKTEIDEDGKLKIPHDIYKHIGAISFLDKEVMKRINEKFFSKKKHLKKLLKK